MDSIITAQIEQCHQCRLCTRSGVQAPLTTAPVPDQPWDDVSLDLFGPLPNANHIVVARCNLSRFPDTKIVKSTAAKDVIPDLAET